MRSAVIDTLAAVLGLLSASFNTMEKFFTPSAQEVSRFTLTFPFAAITEPVFVPFTQTEAPTSPFTSTATEFAFVRVA